jgi:hypothetical protein
MVSTIINSGEDAGGGDASSSGDGASGNGDASERVMNARATISRHVDKRKNFCIT